MRHSFAHRLSLFVLCCATLTAFGADTPAASSTDETFFNKAAIGGMAEVEFGKMAAKKAQNPEVKAFGEMMQTDHSKANDELKSLASKKKVKLPSSLDAEHTKVRADLEAAAGAAFDKVYVAAMVKGHRDTVALFEKAASETQDSEIKTFASKTLPVLRMHLTRIEEMQKKMG